MAPIGSQQATRQADPVATQTNRNRRSATAPAGRPVTVPQTSPTQYISFECALNLRCPDEDTGDWHFDTAWFDYPGGPHRTAPIAGPGGLVDTTPALGDRGVRDMADVLAAKRVRAGPGPVYVADHYRAIADIAMVELAKGRVPTVVTGDVINSWLDTEDQVERLKSYLRPLRELLADAGRQAFDEWIGTVRFD